MNGLIADTLVLEPWDNILQDMSITETTIVGEIALETTVLGYCNGATVAVTY